MGRSKNRPPRLDPPSPPKREPVTAEVELRRARLTGRSAMGITEFRRLVKRAAGGDRRVLGELMPLPALTEDEVWEALDEAFGPAEDAATIDPARTVAAAGAAATRIAEVAGAGGRLAFATARPASMLAVHLGLARLARASGAEILEGDDSSAIRIDGRTERRVRWIDGVACATDGASLLGTASADAPREWLFLLPRPALVVADGPYVEAAHEAGIEVVAFAGPDRPGLAVAAHRGEGVHLVPVFVDRPARAYAPLLAVLEAGVIAALSSAPDLSGTSGAPPPAAP